MSEYAICKTKIKDKQALIEALAEMGFGKEKLEIPESPQHLYGYHSDKRPEKADVIIRRKHIGGSSNDVGFRKEADGTYSPIISEYDGRSMGFNAGWVKKLNDTYLEKLCIRQARQKGFEVKKRVEGKKVILSLFK